MLQVNKITKNDVFLTIIHKMIPKNDPCDTPLGSLKFWKLVKMLAKALNYCAQPIKWDETSFNTPFSTKMSKKPMLSWFSNTNVWGNMAKTRYLVPWYVAQTFWTSNSIFLASPYSFDKNIRSCFYRISNVSSDVATIGCVSDPFAIFKKRMQ